MKLDLVSTFIVYAIAIQQMCSQDKCHAQKFPLPITIHHFSVVLSPLSFICTNQIDHYGWVCICKRIPNAFATELCLCRSFSHSQKYMTNHQKPKPQYCQVCMGFVRAGRSAPVVILLLAWTQRSLCHTCVNRIVQITEARNSNHTVWVIS